MLDYNVYLPYANAYQKKILNLLKTQTQAKVAQTLGVNVRTVERHLRALKETAASMGFDPSVDMQYGCPEGFRVSTVRVNEKGKYIPNFRAHKKDTTLEKIAEAISRPIKPLAKIKEPKNVSDDFLNLYTISDFHLGMLSWSKETGEDWDLDIASDILNRSFQELIKRSENASTCLINILGDFFHIDSILPVTPASKHVLDADTRYFKLIDRGVDLIRHAVETCLKKHKKVILLIAEGNHDESTAPVIQILFNALYEKNPRVEVIKTPKNYYHYVFGNNMLCFHHGHKKRRPSDLNKVFSADPVFRADWGKCKYAYGHTGHLHHERVEDGGCLWTQHPTLAARDAYSARSGYNSMRGCISFTYHTKKGEYSSFYVRPEIVA